MARLPDLAALAAAMQTVVRRSRLPVAVILAGLPELRGRFHGVGTFLERIETLDVGYLSDDATRYALIQPAADVGVAFDVDALDLLVDAAGGYAYPAQVLGGRRSFVGPGSRGRAIWLPVAPVLNPAWSPNTATAVAVPARCSIRAARDERMAPRM